MAGPHRESVGFTLVVSALSVLGALGVGTLLVLTDAPQAVFWATLLAFAPVGPVVGCFLWLDRYEPEPRGLLVSGLAWGAFAATSLAILVQVLLGGNLSEAGQVVGLAPVSEELTKGAFLVLLLWWRRGELDGVLDGIVYAGMVGVGFAFTENILYLASAALEAEALGLGIGETVTATFVLRCVASPFAHPFFTAFLGVGVGVAVNSRTWAGRIGAPLVGYGLAVLTHVVWNASAVLDDGRGFLFVYVVLMAPLFLLAVGGAVWLRSTERWLLTEALDDAARRGLVPATDVRWLVDLPARRAARRHAESLGGRPAREAMVVYQQAAVELAFLHHRYLRGTPPPDFAARGETFVARLSAVRPHISFPGQVVPTR